MQEKFKLGYYFKPFGNKFIEVNLERVLKNISGENFKSLISVARELYSSGENEKYTLYKNKLPAITFSGTFSPTRSSANIVSYSSLIVLDVDKIGENLEIVRRVLFEDQYVVAIWLSPSGDGLKFLISTTCDKDLHKHVYKNALVYFSERYNVNIDKSGSDVSRLCFISYDPNLRSRTDFITFDDWSTPHMETITQKSSNLDMEFLKPINSIRLDNQNDELQKKTIKKIIHFLKKRGLSITSTYEDWVRVGFALSNTFSKDVGKRYFLELCRLDGIRHNEAQSEKLINNCYQKGISSSSFKTLIFLAHSRGYLINYNKSRKLKLN